MGEFEIQNGATYLLDTQTCAAILMRSGVMRRLERVAVGDIAMSAVTLSELMYAVTMSRRTEQDRAALDLLLRHVAVLEYPAAAAARYASMGEALFYKSGKVGAHELLVAAHAGCLGRTLVTERTKTFGLAPRFVGESWAG
ncbi:MAG TPA: PIN domain-containing protein [Acidobacteriaceae bacterium]|jgi:tRNA(fMet)-specific endonuclease VapC|nr:PIN domain-containing protein [Acidobacteriaceae bacterium]